MKKLKRNKTIGQLRDEGDLWECPGCGAENVHSIRYVEAVLKPSERKWLLRQEGVKSIEDLPVTSGSCFETQCGACRNSFAPREIDGRGTR